MNKFIAATTAALILLGGVFECAACSGRYGQQPQCS